MAYAFRRSLNFWWYSPRINKGKSRTVLLYAMTQFKSFRFTHDSIRLGSIRHGNIRNNKNRQRQIRRSKIGGSFDTAVFYKFHSAAGRWRRIDREAGGSDPLRDILFYFFLFALLVSAMSNIHIKHLWAGEKLDFPSQMKANQFYLSIYPFLALQLGFLQFKTNHQRLGTKILRWNSSSKLDVWPPKPYPWILSEDPNPRPFWLCGATYLLRCGICRKLLFFACM